MIRALVPALALAAGCGHPSAVMLPVASASGAGESGTVTKVTDGDTFHVFTGSGSLTVRLLGADSPEVVDPRKPVECAGKEASAFAHRLLDGAHVTLVPDPTQADTDRYHRSLRYVRLDDGRDYSTEIVRAGWARVYTYHSRPVSEYPQLEQAQNEAMAAHAGLWGMCPDPAPGD